MMIKNPYILSVIAVSFLILTGGALLTGADEDKPAFKSAVVSSNLLATQAGEDVLAAGGNAFDAAVAVAGMLSVVEPFGSGLGGGGFWLIYDAEKDEYKMLDARETAPAAAHADMYLDEAGNPVQDLSRNGALSAGIPGAPRALADINVHYGTRPLSVLLAPSIEMAKNGFPVDHLYVRGAQFKASILRRYPHSASVFLDQGEVPQEGWVLKQPDLAKTLEAIGAFGTAGFYNKEQGAGAALVEGNNAAGGIWTQKDLADYRTRWRDPVIGEYQGMRIISAPPPSSGGVVMINALNILSGFDLDALDEVGRKHLIIESMRLAYKERAEHLGDPDFHDVPMARLLSREYADLQRQSINLDKASHDKTPFAADTLKGDQTTHFAVMDKAGNRVAVTRSLNFWFGSGFMPEGTGVLLNNQMDDFVTKAGSENGYRLIGGEANAIAPGKRMLSSMTPTFLESERGIAILGTPGGSRIISMVMLAALEWADGASAQDMVSVPRFHHQYHPDEVTYEAAAFSEDEIKHLQEMGHVLNPSSRRYGNMQVMTFDFETGEIETASDPRTKKKSDTDVY